MKRVLVLGAGGFIGRNLVRCLSVQGYDVVAPGRDLDLRHYEDCRVALRGEPCDAIVHAADVSGNVAWSHAHAGDQLLSNAQMATAVLQAWHEEQPRAQLVGLSSLWAYPDSVAEVREADYWNGRMNALVEHYGVVKKLLGAGIAAFRAQYRMHGTMLVLGNVYGPGDTSGRLIPSLLARMREDPNVLRIRGDASETRDFVYIDDQIQGILRHLSYDGELLNVTTGQSHSVREVIEMLVTLTGDRGRVAYSPSEGAGTAARHVCVDAARAASGWPECATLHSLEEGLRKTVEAGW